MAPMLAGTLQTDPRSGGLKRSSGVNVLPDVAETWAKVRNDKDDSVNWLIASYAPNSKTDITVIKSGPGGLTECSAALLEDVPCFGGLRCGDRFMGFYYASESLSGMAKGRAAMHKNGVLNVLEGRDGEINIKPGMTS